MAHSPYRSSLRRNSSVYAPSLCLDGTGLGIHCGPASPSPVMLAKEQQLLPPLPPFRPLMAATRASSVTAVASPAAESRPVTANSRPATAATAATGKSRSDSIYSMSTAVTAFTTQYPYLLLDSATPPPLPPPTLGSFRTFPPVTGLQAATDDRTPTLPLFGKAARQPDAGHDCLANWPAWRKHLALLSLIFLIALVGWQKTAVISVSGLVASEYDAAPLTAVPLLLSALSALAANSSASHLGSRCLLLLSAVVMLTGACLVLAAAEQAFSLAMAGRCLQGLSWGLADVLALRCIDDLCGGVRQQSGKVHIVAAQTVSVAATWLCPLIGAFIVANDGSNPLRRQYTVLVPLLVLALLSLGLAVPDSRRQDCSQQHTPVASTIRAPLDDYLYTRSYKSAFGSAAVASLPWRTTAATTGSCNAKLCQSPSLSLWRRRARPDKRSFVASMMQALRAAVSPTVGLIVITSFLPYAALWSLAASLAQLPLASADDGEPARPRALSIGLVLLAPALLAIVGVAAASTLVGASRSSSDDSHNRSRDSFFSRSTHSTSTQSKHLSSSMASSVASMPAPSPRPPRLALTNLIVIGAGTLLAVIGLIGLMLRPASSQASSTSIASTANNTMLAIVAVFLGLLALAAYLLDAVSPRLVERAVDVALAPRDVLPTLRAPSAVAQAEQDDIVASAATADGARSDMLAAVAGWRSVLAAAFILLVATGSSGSSSLVPDNGPWAAGARGPCLLFAIAQAAVAAVAIAAWVYFGPERIGRCDGHVMGLQARLHFGSFFDAD